METITIDLGVIDTALNEEFRDATKDYSLKLLRGDNTAIVTGKLVTFNVASNGIIDLDTVNGVVFSIPANETVSKLRIDRILKADPSQIEDDFVTYDLVNEFFEFDGTYTINNIVITFSLV